MQLVVLSALLALPSCVALVPAKPFSFLARSTVASTMVERAPVARMNVEEIAYVSDEALRQSGRGVPLTGETLSAALKMRCDLTGASYAIYWARVGDQLRPMGSIVAKPAVANFVSESMKIVLDANGDGPIATVKRTGKEYWVPDVQNSNLKRRELAYRFGVAQVREPSAPHNVHASSSLSHACAYAFLRPFLSHTMLSTPSPTLCSHKLPQSRTPSPALHPLSLTPLSLTPFTHPFHSPLPLTPRRRCA